MTGNLDEVLRRGLILPMFQPIVDLSTGEMVGAEGLARGPAGPLHSPLALFAEAGRTGRLRELDDLCRRAVVIAARDAPAGVPPLIFVNVEPGTIHLPMSDALRALLADPLPFRIVVEFTERALTQRAAAVVRHCEEIRRRGNVVALDDIGVDPSSVALLPLAQPEIIKLDMSLLAPTVTEHGAAAAVAAAGYAQRTGAMVVAEGIETATMCATAIALGAHWGQGYLFGRPGPIQSLASLPMRADPPPLRQRARVDASASPWDVASRSGAPVRVGDRALLLDISDRLEQQALHLGNLGVVGVALQDAANLTGRTRAAYQRIAGGTGVLAILGRGVPAVPFAGADGVNLGPDEPLAREWVVTVLGPHFAVTLCGRPLGGAALGRDTSYEYVLTHDREVAERIGRLLVRRLTPLDSAERTTALPLDVSG